MALGWPSRRPGAALDEVQEAVGFPLTAETKAALTAVDLVKHPRARARRSCCSSATICPRDAWPERLAAQGATVERQRLPGYTEMMLGSARRAGAEAMVAAAADWLGAAARRRRTPEPAATYTPAPHAQSRQRARDAPSSSTSTAACSASSSTGRRAARRAAACSCSTPARCTTSAPTGSTSRSPVAGPRSATPSCASTSPASATAARARPAREHRLHRRASADIAAALALSTPPDRRRRVCTRSGSARALQRLQGRGRRRAARRHRAHQPADLLLQAGHVARRRPAPRRREAARYTAACRASTPGRSCCAATCTLPSVAKVMLRRAATSPANRARSVARRPASARRRSRRCELQTVTRRNVDVRFLFAADDPGVTCSRPRAARPSAAAPPGPARHRHHRRRRPHLHAAVVAPALVDRIVAPPTSTGRRARGDEPRPHAPRPDAGARRPARLAILLVLAHNFNVIADPRSPPARVDVRHGMRLGRRAAVLRAVRLPDHRHPARHPRQAATTAAPSSPAACCASSRSTTRCCSPRSSSCRWSPARADGRRAPVWLWIYLSNWVEPVRSRRRRVPALLVARRRGAVLPGVAVRGARALAAPRSQRVRRARSSSRSAMPHRRCCAVALPEAAVPVHASAASTRWPWARSAALRAPRAGAARLRDRAASPLGSAAASRSSPPSAR